MNEETYLIPKTVETYYSDPKYFRIHQIVSIIFFIYYIYASIVNANDGLPWSGIHILLFTIAAIISIGHMFIKNKKHWVYFFRLCIFNSLSSFSLFVYWAIIYFSKQSRENIAIDKDGQDFAGYFILFVWNLYLVFVSYRLSKNTNEEFV